MKKEFQRRKPLTGAVSIQYLFYLILLLLSVIVGIKFGIRIGAKYGILFAVIGALAGSILGVCFAIFVVFFAALVSWPFEAFSRWWRPHPPPCENKSCSLAGYSIELLPEDFINKNPGFSPIAYRCKKCGNLYACFDSGRFVRILPDEGLKPYLRHKPFGRWQTDHDTDFIPAIPMSEEIFFGIAGCSILIVGIPALFLTRYLKYEWVADLGIVGTVCGAILLLLVLISRISTMRKSIEKQARTERLKPSGQGNIPAWIFPWISAFMIGGVASLTLLRKGSLHDPVVRWMIGGCTALGFMAGLVAWGVLYLKEKKINRIGSVSFKLIGDVIIFFGVKLIALIPGAVCVGVWVKPLVGQSLQERICVSLITGGLFLAGFFVDGISLSQYRRDSFTGINLYFRRLAGIGLILTIIGFAIGFI